MTNKLPYTINTIFDQIGTSVLGQSSGLAYVGAHRLQYSFPADGDVNAEVRSSKPSVYDETKGTLAYEVGVSFKVNVSKKTCKFYVTYEPDDLYSVYFLKISGDAALLKTGKLSTLISEFHGVYGDGLQSIIESEYDKFIRAH